MSADSSHVCDKGHVMRFKVAPIGTLCATCYKCATCTIERQQRQIEALKEVARNRCILDLEDTVEMDIADIEEMK
jgi:hypothetical protein